MQNLLIWWKDQMMGDQVSWFSEKSTKPVFLVSTMEWYTQVINGDHYITWNEFIWKVDKRTYQEWPKVDCWCRSLFSFFLIMSDQHLRECLGDKNQKKNAQTHADFSVSQGLKLMQVRFKSIWTKFAVNTNCKVFRNLRLLKRRQKLKYVCETLILFVNPPNITHIASFFVSMFSKNNTFSFLYIYFLSINNPRTCHACKGSILHIWNISHTARASYCSFVFPCFQITACSVDQAVIWKQYAFTREFWKSSGNWR